MAKLHFVASSVPEAQTPLGALRARYEDAGAKNADIVIALGGDGFMLQTLHSFLGQNKPIYGMNLGSVGFLMNEYSEDKLASRIEAAEPAMVHPLRMRAQTGKQNVEGLAFNEVSLLRQTRQTAKIISAFRPRRWRGALLSHRAQVRFEIVEAEKRPVSAVADDFEVRDVKIVDVAEDRSVSMTMLFDQGHSLDERILAEQFVD